MPLFVGEAVVRTHIAHVLQRFGLRDRVQLVILAQDTVLIEPGGKSG